MNRPNAIAFATLLSLCAIAGYAGEKPLSEQKINAVIEQLVSPNRAPDDKHGPYPNYPVGFDDRAQERVRAAWKQLYDDWHHVLPYLFDRFDDMRYCFTDDTGSKDTNWSVGRACSDILICHLQPYGGIAYRRDVGFRARPSYPEHYNLRSSAGAKIWWETRKDKPLRELQIEALEWVVAEEAKSPEKYPGWDRLVLQRELAKLRAGAAPLAPSVPWVQ